MKHSVAYLLAASAGAVGLGACGGSPELETGEVYCFASGDDPDRPEYSECDYVEGIYVYRDGGTFEVVDLAQSNGFKEVGSLSGRVLTLRDQEIRAQGSKGRLKFRADGMTGWLIPAKSSVARKVGRYARAMEKFDPSATPPEGQPAYVDVPLCYKESHYVNGQRRSSMDGCNSSATFFSSTGRIVYVDLDSVSDEDKPVEWEDMGSWSKAGGVGRPDAYKDFKWSLSDEGFPTSARAKRTEDVQFYSGRAYDPNLREVQIEYEFYLAGTKTKLPKRIAPQFILKLSASPLPPSTCPSSSSDRISNTPAASTNHSKLIARFSC